MPMPKRASVDDYFAQLSDTQRPHLEALRELSRAADPEAREELKWNLPVYVRGWNTNLWMLQNFKNHCSLRFSPAFFATQKSTVEAAGYDSGEGFVKLPYDRELPTELLQSLMRARIAETERPTATPPGPTGEQAAAAGALPEAEQRAMVEAMVQRLADRLKAQPDDVDGWRRLARAYTVLGRKPQAAEAWRQVLRRDPADAAARTALAP